MVFNEIANNDFILLSKQARTHLIYSTEHVFENFEGEFPGCSPVIAGSASKTCQYHLEQWFSNFHEPWRPSKDSQHLWPPAHQWKYLVLASARGPCSASACSPQRTASVVPKGARAPFKKPWLRNKSCKRLGSRQKRPIKPCYTNWTIK